MKVYYGVGEPPAVSEGFDLYVDLDTDSMYRFENGEWVLTHQHGEPVGGSYYDFGGFQ